MTAKATRKYVVLNPRNHPKGVRILCDADGAEFNEGDAYTGRNATAWLASGFIKEAR